MRLRVSLQEHRHTVAHHTRCGVAMVSSWNPLERLFAVSAASFHGSLGARDVALLRLAQRLFLGNNALSLVLYYGLEASPDGRAGTTKFPATISWTIRRGLPKWTNLALWSAGWWQVNWAPSIHAVRHSHHHNAVLTPPSLLSCGCAPSAARWHASSFGAATHLPKALSHRCTFGASPQSRSVPSGEVQQQTSCTARARVFISCATAPLLLPDLICEL